MTPILKTIRVPTLSGDPVAFRGNNPVHIEEMPIELEPFGTDHNRVKITLGGVTRIVDGISLCTAIDDVITAVRGRRT